MGERFAWTGLEFLPADLDEWTTSSTYGPVSANLNGQVADVILLSKDLVLFYAHERTLLDASSNSFRGLLPFATTGDVSQRIVFINDISSHHLNILLNVVHNTPVAHPNLASLIEIQTLIQAIDLLPVYGISPGTYITPASHFGQYLLSCGPLHPLEIYALAAQHDLQSLAIAVSSHSLVVELSQVDDNLALRMGAVYLRRLFQLHIYRTDTLKRLLSTDIGLHNPTRRCGFDDQNSKLKARWNGAVASLLPVIKSDTSTTVIRDRIVAETSDIQCRDCLKLRDDNIQKIIAEWTLTRRTI